MDRILEPESFWQEYSSQLNQARNWDAYQNSTKWTETVMGIADETCKKFKSDLETSKEYYRIDLIGYRREEPNVDCNWWLDIAYEHENDDTWHGELCKLCYVAADLRVISSYYNLGNEGKTVEDRIKESELVIIGELDSIKYLGVELKLADRYKDKPPRYEDIGFINIKQILYNSFDDLDSTKNIPISMSSVKDEWWTSGDLSYDIGQNGIWVLDKKAKDSVFTARYPRDFQPIDSLEYVIGIIKKLESDSLKKNDHWLQESKEFKEFVK